jgi:uncharacterized RDD family membrane protein YckC
MKRDGDRNGQDWGKQIVGIRVVKDDGQPVTFGFALLREVVVKGLLIGIVSNLTAGIAGLLDGLWPLWDNTNQALHDKVVSTHVIQA